MSTYPQEFEDLEEENERLKDTIKAQGEECEKRHNTICEIREINNGLKATIYGALSWLKVFDFSRAKNLLEQALKGD